MARPASAHRNLVVANVVAWPLMAALVAAAWPPVKRMLREVGVPLPRATDAVATFVETPGLVVAALALVVTMICVPAWLAPREAAVRSWLWLGLLQAFGAAVGGLFAVFLLPIVSSIGTFQCLCPPGCPHGGDGRLLSALPVLAATIAQLHPWSAIARTILAQPRETPELEAARLLFLAAPPGAVLALVAAVVLDVIDPTGPAPLVVPVPLAGAGTVLAATAVVALAVRVRAGATS